MHSLHVVPILSGGCRQEVGNPLHIGSWARTRSTDLHISPPMVSYNTLNSAHSFCFGNFPFALQPNCYAVHSCNFWSLHFLIFCLHSSGLIWGLFEVGTGDVVWRFTTYRSIPIIDHLAKLLFLFSNILLTSGRFMPIFCGCPVSLFGLLSDLHLLFYSSYSAIAGKSIFLPLVDPSHS